MYQEESLDKHKKSSKKGTKKQEKTMTQSSSEVHTETKNKDEKTDMAVAQKVSSLKEDASNPDNYSKKDVESAPTLLNQSKPGKKEALPEIDQKQLDEFEKSFIDKTEDEDEDTKPMAISQKEEKIDLNKLS